MFLRHSALILLGCSLLASVVSAGEGEDFFERRIRPLLVKNCISCHGPKKQESDLRLDSRAAVLLGGISGQIVTPGRPEQSRLLEAVSGSGDLQMPPNRKLDKTEISDLTSWVKLKLPWPDKAPPLTASPAVLAKGHWAFQPIGKSNLPTVKRSQWVRNPIDTFVLSRLEQNQLEPSSDIDRRAFIRRATFDLLGLPPTPTEVHAFLNDQRPGAVERLVDRLLASPRYGERWSRHWLDVARYADNKGYVFFEDKAYPWAYAYRDYVVDAWNEDKPFDQFVIEQLAADQLELKDPRPLAAMGFLTVGPHFMNNSHDIIDDRIDVVTRGLMGLTVTCARCHDHKFDPLSQADYYGLYGVFRSSFEPTLPPLFTVPPDTEGYRKFADEMAKREKQLTDFVDRTYEELSSGARSRIPEYLMAAHQQRNQPPTDNFMLLTDKGAPNPTVILRWRIYLEKSQGKDDPIWLPWHVAAELPADEFAQRASEALKQLADKPLNPLVRQAVVDVEQPWKSLQDLADRYGALFSEIDTRWREQQKTARSSGAGEGSDGLSSDGVGSDAGPGSDAVLADPHAERLRTVLYGHDSPPNIPKLFGWGFLALLPDRPTQNEFKKLLKEVETWSVKGEGAPARAMVLLDAPQLHEPRIFLRGNPNRLGASTKRRFPAMLNPGKRPFRRGSGRLELARAIVAPSNPLTSRVIVNRIWRQHFGRGLVTTPSDFGLRSELPSHPQLLDYLATRLIAEGWSIKRLQRLILTSATYRQQSLDRRDARRVDPENRLLWKVTRRRLDFEATRDALLQVSGDMNWRFGGPPEALFDNSFKPRRTVYGFVNRMDLPPLLSTFDFPPPLASSPGRSTTTVSPQALFMMNSPFVAEVAKRLAGRRDLAVISEPDRKVEYLYELLFARPPRETERQLALRSVADKARFERYLHALLMTNEFVFVD